MSGAERADREWMEQALALAALGEGVSGTHPRARVGCIVVREGRVVGRGYHDGVGQPHAEAVALAEAGPWARGSTLYVNLEPCAHVGHTPPCADLLIRAGVARVVASLRDPNPLVDGRGFERLRRAHVAVEVGLLEREARRINEAFLHRHETGRPLVTIKAAVTLDGMLSAAGAGSPFITGDPARRFARRLRLRHDAVLVGAGTVRRDDPRLTLRLPGVSARRLRVVLAPTLDLDPGCRLFSEPGEPKPRIYTGGDVPAARRESFAARADVVPVALDAEGRLDLGAVLADLERVGVQSVLVEGGGRTIATFLAGGFADRAALFLAPRLLGARGGTPLVDRHPSEPAGPGWRIEAVRQVTLGGDLLLLGRLRTEPHAEREA